MALWGLKALFGEARKEGGGGVESFEGDMLGRAVCRILHFWVSGHQFGGGA